MTMRAKTVNVIRLDFGAGRVEDIPAPSFEELTVEDYIRIAEPPEHVSADETELDIFVRVFGIDRDLARFVKLPEMEKILGVYLDYVRNGRQLVDRIKAVTEELDTMEANGEKWDVALIRDRIASIRPIPRELVLDGVTYRVPQAIDADTVFGQYFDVRKIIREHEGTEAELYPKLLAVLCLEPGETYDPARNLERERIMAGVPYVDALALTAFFFSTSERLRETLSLNSRFSLGSRTPSSGQTPTSSTPAGEPSAN